MPLESVDLVFAALADRHRREMVSRLARHGRMRTGDLLDGLPMTRQGANRHLGVLETSGLVTSHRVGRVVYRELNLQPLRGTGEWLDQIDRQWQAALNRLAAQYDTE